jgi:hypothetical protein
MHLRATYNYRFYDSVRHDVGGHGKELGYIPDIIYICLISPPPLHAIPHVYMEYPTNATRTDPNAVFDFKMDQPHINLQQHDLSSYDLPDSYSNQYTPSLQGQSKNTDAVFDFQMRSNGTSHSVNPQSLQMKTMGLGLPDDDHRVRTNQQFARHLDLSIIQEQTKLMDNGFDATADITNLFLQSTRLVEERNYESIIMTYLSFSHTSNLLARDVSNSFKRSIISSMKLLDTSSICQQLQFDPPQQELVQFERKTTNIYGDYSQWEKILQILSFPEEQTRDYLLTVDSDFGNDLPTIKFVLATLEQVGADVLSMSDALKLYLITNIKSVSSVVAVKAFLAATMHATFDASEAANMFTASMADTRFTQEEFASDLAWFMMNVVVCPVFTEKCIFFMETQQSMLRWSQNEEIKHHRGRVSLRHRVVNSSEAMSKVNGTVYGDNGISGNTEDNQTAVHCANVPASQTSQLYADSLPGWTSRARVPPAISHKSKLLGYLLMSQQIFADPTNAIRTHFTNDSTISENILAQSICKPHASPIIEFIRLLTVHVTRFDELTAFRQECFADFSHTDSKDLSWLKFLQLYIAIYQHDDIWTIVWRSLCGVLSHQVLIAIANFKGTHVYAVDKVVEICMRTEQSGLKSVDEVFH